MMWQKLFILDILNVFWLPSNLNWSEDMSLKPGEEIPDKSHLHFNNIYSSVYITSAVKSEE